mgnify:FL=1
MGKIKTTLIAQNYAPLKNFHEVIDSDSLRITIYADNGEGKTFISKAFRMIEDTEMPLSNPYLSFGETKGNFSFRISNDEGNELEKFEIAFEKDKQATCSKPINYIFHTFNQEFIEENIRSVSFDKQKDHIDGYIIGKAKIDIKEDEDKLKEISEEATRKHSAIHEVIDRAIKSIDGIPNIRRIQEYGILSKEYIFLNYTKPISSIEKSVTQYIEEYDLIKSIPENIEPLQELHLPVIDSNWLGKIVDDLVKSFSVSNIAEEFKNKVRAKQLFIEEGVKLLPNSKCPFCEQVISKDASTLLDQYVNFFNDEEAKNIKRFRGYIDQLNQLKQSFTRFCTEVIAGKSRASEYISKYLPSAGDKLLDEIDITNIITFIDKCIETLETKIKNISIALTIEDVKLKMLAEYKSLQTSTKSNNSRISEINKVLSDSTEANRNIRRNICKALFNEIIETVGPQIEECIKLTKEKDNIIASIKEKRKAERVARLDKVSETIKTILNVFFNGKYTFDDKSFLLQCHGTPLMAGQASHVLSEGEKSIIAFAYYLGDIFVKIIDEDDYERLFFIIDDPISSMDFNYVYVLSTIIRDLGSYIPISKHIRIILLTHNLEFMRIIVGNRIMGNCYVLKKGELKKFNSSYTIPYISHLHDIYRISIGKSTVNHTTANSIRHILESLLKFEYPQQNASLAEYVKHNLPDDKHTYTLIQDLSHGGIRPETDPIKEEDYLEICRHVIKFITDKYPGQIEYCKTLT